MVCFYCCCKFCCFIVEGVEFIDFKDLDILKVYIIEIGKIVFSCIIGIKVCYQCQLVFVVKQVCFLVLLLYVDSYDN